RGLLPTDMLAATHRRKRDDAGADRHHDRSADDLRQYGMRRTAQLTENENPPQQSPQLVRVREWNPACNPRVLDGILLKQISDDPHETARQEPEENVTRTRQLRPERTGAPGISESEHRHHSQLTDGEEGDEREGAHPGEIGFAIRYVHRSPQHTGGQCGGDTASCITRWHLRR